MKFDVLIVGNYPPPIGGVTIHVKRLLDRLSTSTFTYSFIDLRREGVFTVLKSIFSTKMVHLHSSNSYLKLALAAMCFILRRPLLMTYHGNLGRYGKFRNGIDMLAIWLAKVPIMINEQSLAKAKQINYNAHFASAFIPPKAVENLDETSRNKIASLRTSSKFLFCTNASNVSYDVNGKEIYQITDLIKLFNRYLDLGLIISDPKGDYRRMIEKSGLIYNQNILFFDFGHDFNAVIEDCDCMLRFTTTDGDSLSVKEALFAGKNVIATDVVNRSSQVTLVRDDIKDLEEKVTSYQPSTISFNEDGFNEISEIYNFYLNH